MSARTRLRVVHLRVLRALARDVTAAWRNESVLVLAPHPDDETIGCGGTIAGKRLVGTDVRVVIAADGGDDVRRAECIEACRRLGVDDDHVTFLGLPDGGLGDHRDELVAALTDLLHARPRQLLVPSAIDAHPDHRALAAAVAEVTASMPGTDVFEYPIWFWNRWAWVDRTTPPWRQRLELVGRPLAQLVSTRCFTVSTAATLERKRAALAAYRSQLAPDDGSGGLDPEWLDMFLGPSELFFGARVR